MPDTIDEMTVLDASMNDPVQISDFSNIESAVTSEAEEVKVEPESTEQQQQRVIKPLAWKSTLLMSAVMILAFILAYDLSKHGGFLVPLPHGQVKPPPLSLVTKLQVEAFKRELWKHHMVKYAPTCSSNSLPAMLAAFGSKCERGVCRVGTLLFLGKTGDGHVLSSDCHVHLL